MKFSPKTKLLRHKFGVIGFGKMAEALISGAMNAGVIARGQTLTLAHRPERDTLLRRKYGARVCKDMAPLCREADVLLLAVKPLQMTSVLADLAPHVGNKLIITVAAALPLATYRKALGKSARIVRVMPNTPAMVGCGAAGYFAGKNVSPADKKACEIFFSATGLLVELKKEALIDSVIAVSGSGPAFVYRYADAVIANGIKMGLSPDVSRRLAVKTLQGAARMLEVTGLPADELIAQVASKKGTTLAGLDAMDKNGFTVAIAAAMNAAVTRSREIALELKGA